MGKTGFLGLALVDDATLLKDAVKGVPNANMGAVDAAVEAIEEGAARAFDSIARAMNGAAAGNAAVTLGFDARDDRQVSGMPDDVFKSVHGNVTLPDEAPALEGFKFAGWRLADDTIEAVGLPGSTWTVRYGGETLVALWRRDNGDGAAALTFDTNAGRNARRVSGMPSDIGIEAGYSVGDVIALPANVPEWSSYAFLGWAYSDTAAEPDFLPGAAYALLGVNDMLYAVWGDADGTQVSTLSFDGNCSGVSGLPADVTGALGSAVTLSADEPVRNGLTFLGWATSPTGPVVYKPGDELKLLTATLYAVWGRGEGGVSMKTYYKSDVGASVSYVNYPVVPNGNIGGFFKLPVAAGNSDIYHNARLVGYQSFYTRAEALCNMDDEMAVEVEYPPGSWFPVDEAKPIVACVWARKLVPDANGGEGETPGGNMLHAPECGFARDGFVFKEWNTKADGSGAAIAPGAAITTWKYVDDWRNTGLEPLTLYAQWAESSGGGV